MRFAGGHFFDEDLNQQLEGIPHPSARAVLAVSGATWRMRGILRARESKGLFDEGVVAGQVDFENVRVGCRQSGAGLASQAQPSIVGRIGDNISGDIAAPVVGDLATVSVDDYLSVGSANSDPPSCQLGWRRVVNIANTAVTIPAHPYLGATIGVGQRISKRIQEVLLRSPSIGNLPNSAVVTLERHFPGPEVMLSLEIADRVELTQAAGTMTLDNR